MNKIPTAEEFLKKSDNAFYKNDLIEFAKLHVQEALIKASEEVTHNIEIDWLDPYDYSAGHNGIKGNIDKESILNAYNLDNIK